MRKRERERGGGGLCGERRGGHISLSLASHLPLRCIVVPPGRHNGSSSIILSLWVTRVNGYQRASSYATYTRTHTCETRSTLDNETRRPLCAIEAVARTENADAPARDTTTLFKSWRSQSLARRVRSTVLSVTLSRACAGIVITLLY